MLLMAVATRTSILFRPSLLAAALTELRRQLRPASAMVLALGLMCNPALADDSSQKKTESGRFLDWVPMEQLTEAQNAAMPKGCCGDDGSADASDVDASCSPAHASDRATAGAPVTQGQATVIMTGDVQIAQGYRALNGDRATFNQATRRAEIAGDSQVREPGMLLHA